MQHDKFTKYGQISGWQNEHKEWSIKMLKEAHQGIKLLIRQWFTELSTVSEILYILLSLLHFFREAAGGRLKEVNENIRVDGLYGFYRVTDAKERTGFLINMHAVSCRITPTFYFNSNIIFNIVSLSFVDRNYRRWQKIAKRRRLLLFRRRLY